MSVRPALGMLAPPGLDRDIPPPERDGDAVDPEDHDIPLPESPPGEELDQIIGAIAPDPLLEAIERDGLALVARVEQKQEDGQPRSRSLAELLADPDATKPPEAVVPGIAWTGRLTLIAAREGFGKSTLLTAVAAPVTTGGMWLGERCARGAVLWVLVEEHLNDVVIRAVKFQTAPDALHVLERPDAPLDTLMAEVDRLHPTLVIVDTLHRFASGLVKDASAADQWGRVMTTLDTIARRGNTAVLLSAQAVKATGEYRDSSEIGHGVDVVLNLVRPEKDSPVRKLEKQKARWPLDDVTFEMAGATYQRGGTISKRLSKQRQRVLDALEPPMTYTEWHEASGVPATTFDRAIKHLVSQGYVAQTPDGAYILTPVTPVSPPSGVAGVEPTVPPVTPVPSSRLVRRETGVTAGVAPDPDTVARAAMREGV